METRSPATMEERVARLETQNRRLGRLAAALLLAAAWPLLVAVEKPRDAKTVEAEKVVLRDAKGAVRAELGSDPDGSMALKLLDGKGGTAISLRAAPAAPILELADGAGGTVWVSVSATGASISLSKGKGEIELATRATGEPAVKLQNRDGKIVWQAP